MRPLVHTFEYAIETLQASLVYSLLIASLAIFSLLMLAYEFSPWADPAIVPITQRLDLAIAWIFLTDFFAGLIGNRSVTKKTYFKQNWLNLISSIPVTDDAVRVLRILRVLRAFRIIRAATNLYFASSRYRRNKSGVH